jgi:hypothetical protein
VLLVDDHQPEVAEGHAFLDERVGAHCQQRAAFRQGGERRLLFRGRHRAGEQHGGDAQRLEQAGEH